MPTVTESVVSITNLTKTSDMSRISSSCLIVLTKLTTALIPNLSRHSKFCSSCMLNTSWTVQLLQSVIFLHRESISIPLLLEPQELCMVPNTEELTRQCLECWRKSGRKRTFPSLLSLWRTEKVFSTVSGTEFIRTMTPEQHWSRR